MPAIGNIVINDGESTPVAHTFAPLSVTGPLAIYEDRAGGISVGFPRISLSVLPPSKTSRLTKVRAKLVYPVLEVVNSSTYSGITPAPTKAYDVTADLTFFMPERSTLQQRKNLNALFKNFLANAAWTAVVENLEAVY